MNQEKSSPTRTPYEILGISINASVDEIENAYKRARLYCNPSNFEEDSPERERAIKRNEDITAAYVALIEKKSGSCDTQNTTANPNEKLFGWLPLLLTCFIVFSIIAFIRYFFYGTTIYINGDGDIVDAIDFLYIIFKAFLYSLIMVISPTLFIYFLLISILHILAYVSTDTPYLHFTVFSFLWTVAILRFSYEAGRKPSDKFEFGKKEPLYVKMPRRLSIGYKRLHENMKRDIHIIRNRLLGNVK